MEAASHRLSVIVTSGDRPELLAWSVESALAQEGADVEVLVAGAPTPHRLTDDERVRTLDVDPDRTPVAALSAGLRAAGGEWIGFLEAGDWWRPDRVRRQLADPAVREAALAYAGRVAVDRHGRLLGYVLPEDAAGLPQRLRLANTLGAGSSVLVRADVLHDAGGFDERLQVLAAWRLWIALLATGRATACADLLVVELGDRPRADLRAPRRTIAEVRLLAREGLLAPRAQVDTTLSLAGELRRDGRRREAASLYLLSAMSHGRPQDVMRAAATLMRRPAVPETLQFVSPAWLPPPPGVR